MKKAIQKLQQMLDWSDRLGSDEIYEINEVILSLKLETSTVDVIKELKNTLENKLVSTKQVIDLIDNHIEYLETSEGDQLPSITVENLRGLLDNYFNK